MDIFDGDLPVDFLKGVDFLKAFSLLDKPVAIKNAKGDPVYMNELAKKYESSSNNGIFLSFNEEESKALELVNNKSRISIEKIIKIESGSGEARKFFFHVESIILYDHFGMYYGTLFIFHDMTTYVKKVLESADDDNSFKVYDDLTGFLVKSRFMEITEKEIDRAKRHNIPISLVFFAIENLSFFKQSYGEEKMLQLIKYVGAFFRQKFRKLDHMFYFDFNEFCALLPHLPAYMAEYKFEKMKREISETIKSQGFVSPVLVYGIAQFDLKRHGIKWNSLIDEAKDELHKNKSLYYAGS